MYDLSVLQQQSQPRPIVTISSQTTPDQPSHYQTDPASAQLQPSSRMSQATVGLQALRCAWREGEGGRFHRALCSLCLTTAFPPEPLLNQASPLSQPTDKHEKKGERRTFGDVLYLSLVAKALGKPPLLVSAAVL